MTSAEPQGLDAYAERPLDDADDALLRRLAAVYTALDPVPPGLVESSKLAISFATMDAELATLQDSALLTGAARYEAPNVSTLAFATDTVNTLITISPSTPDHVRIDGWVAPGAGAIVELRQDGSRRDTVADDDGHFVFDDVPHALTHFRIAFPHAPGRRPVETPNVDI